jgi:anti-sigma factor RsiW
MAHFDATTWADYVRGVLGERQRAAVERHAAVCRSCASTIGWLRDVARLAAADSQFEPPPAALRHVRALFAIEQPRLVRTLPRLLARLTFDSLSEPLPAGVRGSSGLSRQSVFEAADYAIDLTVDQPPGSPRIMLVGQVVSRTAGREPMMATPVVLMAGTAVIARTVCDRYGEFLLEYDPQPRLRLHLVVDGGKRRIELPLDASAAVRTRAVRTRRNVTRKPRRRQ